MCTRASKLILGENQRLQAMVYWENYGSRMCYSKKTSKWRESAAPNKVQTLMWTSVWYLVPSLRNRFTSFQHYSLIAVASFCATLHRTNKFSRSDKAFIGCAGKTSPISVDCTFTSYRTHKDLLLMSWSQKKKKNPQHTKVLLSSYLSESQLSNSISPRWL